MELHRLGSVKDNPKFEGFTYKDRDPPSLLGHESRDDDLTPGFGRSSETRIWSQPSLRESWVPLEVIGRVAAFHDFPGLMSLPAFSQRACNVLRDMLEPNGELLPLKSQTKRPYFFYNVTRIVDALDIDNSDCTFRQDPSRVSSISYFSFHRDRLVGLDIFRIIEQPMLTIVSDRFVNRVLEAGLNGFSFTKIWPLEKGKDWRFPRDRQRIETTGSDKFQLKQQTLILCFSLEADELSSPEEERLEQFGVRLDSKLAVETLDAPYHGNYEISSIDDREFRMFISTPNADSLLEYIAPLIKSFDWKNGLRIMKSDKGIHDRSAKQKQVSEGGPDNLF